MDTITFILEPADMNALHKFLAIRAKSWRLSRYIIIAVVIGAFMSMAWSELKEYHSFSSVNWLPLLETTVLPIAVVVIFWCLFTFQARKQSQSDPLFTNPQTLSVGAKELVWQHLGATTVRQWPSITEIASDDSAIYFYVGENVEHFVPKRVFQNVEQAEVFQKTAVSHWKSKPIATEKDANIWPPAPLSVNSQEPGSKP